MNKVRSLCIVILWGFEFCCLVCSDMRDICCSNCQAEAIKEKIGYPDYIMNDTALNLDYEGVSKMLNIFDIQSLESATLDVDTIETHCFLNFISSYTYSLIVKQWTKSHVVVN